MPKVNYLKSGMKNGYFITANKYNIMELEDYNKKRDFDKTSEPEGVVEKDNGKLIFVVKRNYSSN